jgi:hypothetical protein
VYSELARAPTQRARHKTGLSSKVSNACCPTGFIAGRGENSVCRPEQLFIIGFAPIVVTGTAFVMLLQSL